MDTLYKLETLKAETQLSPKSFPFFFFFWIQRLAQVHQLR